ncbi:MULTISPECIES: helix-turn-helix transcriptional regulator [unclassified Moraxella]|uniref:helix-turn-helix transcriptional regulator n=1 Tax=unclassified Moraxella TaxID=2685852 RepID=UPI003AF95563
MTQNQPITLPPQGVSRAKQILQLVPIGKTTLYKLVKQGKFPQPIKLGENTTVWRNAEVLAWLDNLDSQTA